MEDGELLANPNPKCSKTTYNQVRSQGTEVLLGLRRAFPVLFPEYVDFLGCEVPSKLQTQL